MPLAEELRAAFGERVRQNAPLARFTTFKVGGPADWLVEAAGAADVQRALMIGRRTGIPVTMLGGGSNVLVADGGVRGIVVRLHGGQVQEIDANRIRADAGVTINGLVRWTINHGVAGIEAWAGTPGTVGGAVHGNAHFQRRNIGDLIDRVAVAGQNGDVTEVPAEQMEFGYDTSRLQRTGEKALWVDFRVGRGDPAALRGIARASLAFRKQTQPLDTPSAGCIFQNPDPAVDRVPAGIPASAGALVERAGLKGAREGGAHVSTTHANFIVNDGRASARDIRRLIARCKQAVRDQFGVELREEIVYLGEFDR
jgi:UDP-N-acetylmuramate dehydrogenase